MRKELAMLLAAALSIVPGGGVAALGDGRAQYGFLLVLIASPFYVLGIAVLARGIEKVATLAGAHSRRAYRGISLLVSLTVCVSLLLAGGGWASALAAWSSLLNALWLVPWLESKRRA